MWAWTLLCISAAGTTELAQFDVSNWAGLVAHPGRMAGSLIGLGLWALLLGGAILALVSSIWTGAALRWAAGLLTLGSLALVPVHLVANAGGWRPAAGALLAVLAFVATFRMRRADRRMGYPP